MSIIEKAVNKATPPGAVGADIGPGAGSGPADGGSLIEKAFDKEQAVSDQRHEPVPAPEPEAAESAPARQQSISLARLKRVGMITPADERSQMAEEFRLIKRPLLANAFGQGGAPIDKGNMIMVTSALPGEGKTFCAINLAISIAMEMDRTVLLVDADVAKPRIPDYLGLEVEKGLLDVLRDDHLTLADVLIRTDVEKLTILPAGRTYRRATELLASEAMDSLISEISQRYPDRLVIFDSPPLLSTTESSVLATHMGQIVMVVEAERTPQEALKEALAQIESCEVVGMLLNKATPLPGANYYGYYYGGYGS